VNKDDQNFFDFERRKYFKNKIYYYTKVIFWLFSHLVILPFFKVACTHSLICQVEFFFEEIIQFFVLVNPDIYLGKETFLPSGYGFPMAKGLPLKKHVDIL
jgi:hypothetical protein